MGHGSLAVRNLISDPEWFNLIYSCINSILPDYSDSRMSSNDVRLAIEGNQESFIQEIALNGQETWIQPLSMGEKLQLSTQKIDFFKELDRDVKPEPDSEEAVIIDEPQARFEIFSRNSDPLQIF